jgi:putative endonuclease
MKDADRMDAGRAGENAALTYLEAQGLQLLTRNYRCTAGEIDLVMREQRLLVLVEVRLRSRSDYGNAASSVTRAKQRRIIRAAGHLLLVHAELRPLRARFDVIAISRNGTAFGIDWIKDAFRQ